MRVPRNFDRLIDAQSDRFELPALRILLREGERAARAVEQGADPLAAVSGQEWLAYLTRVWMAIVPQAGELVSDVLEKQSQDIFVRAAIGWLRNNGAERIVGITDTSRDVIGDQIRIGTQKGETTQQIADRIRKHRRSISPGRAEVIARTEVHAAANYGSQVAAIESRIPMKKVWTARADARDAHQAASGQKRALNDTFRVGGERLMYPGDSSFGGSAANVCNCRCILGYELEPRVTVSKPRRRAA
jgi:Phage Mu protein F like protein